MNTTVMVLHEALHEQVEEAGWMVAAAAYRDAALEAGESDGEIEADLDEVWEAGAGYGSRRPATRKAVSA